MSTPRYQLTNCTGQVSPLYTEQDLSQYLGKYVAVQGSLECYLVSEVACDLLRVSFSLDGTDYSYDVQKTGTQNGYNYYELNITSGIFNQITIFWDNTPANLSEYTWRVNIRNTSNNYSISRFNSTDSCPISDDWLWYPDGSYVEIDTGTLVVDFATPSLIEGCDCVKLTYTLVGEEPVTVEVVGTDLADGKYQYPFSIIGIDNFIISFGVDSIYWGLDPVFTVLLNEDTTCPFGTYTIEEGSIFEAFSVVPCNPPLVIEYCYPTCEECSTKSYRVYSCSSDFEIFSTDPRSELLASEDQVIRIPFYNNGCFKIEQVSYDRTKTYIPVLDYSGIYNNCIDCYPRETVEPLVEFGICDPQKVVDIKCDFAEMMYQQMMSRRLGIEFCCPIEKGKATLKNDIIDFALLPDELPDLPEPYVEYCCIPITTDNCPPEPCTTCTETVVEVEDCNCTASENSPHPCHTYQVTVLGNQLLLAAGNTNGSQNGKVYFAYFKCKATKPTVVEYTTAQTNPYCVLGIPVFGYYANNEWVNLPLTRGEECPEEQITNTCCNG